MSSAVEQDGSEDVNDFLKRIRELGDKRDREDEERTKRLEEEILQGRKERQARRAERARSISPTKDSPSNTPQSLRSSAVNTPVQYPAESPSTDGPQLSPQTSRESARNESLEALNGDMSSMQENIDPRRSSGLGDSHKSARTFGGSPNRSPSSAIAPSKPTSLSWQRRPMSQAPGSPRSRPLSAIASENNANKSPRASPALRESGDEEPSRNQIAQSLGSKDPSWFRQTPDRGVGSAAYRRGTNESAGADVFVGGSMRLPGMSRESTAEPERQASPVSERMRSTSPSRGGSTRGFPGSMQPPSNDGPFPASTGGERRSPFPTSTSQVLDPTPSDNASIGSGQPQDRSSAERIISMSPSQGRISPDRMDRPPSPTKGLGGFVQSAMLKRSDSVNKRWSAQPTTGLVRGNSVANRNPYGGPGAGLAGGAPPLSPSKAEGRPSSLSREASPRLDSRPTSSQSSSTAFENIKESTIDSMDDSTEDATTPKPSLDRSGSKDSDTSGYFDSKDVATRASAVPSSPSKGMGHKRWSPSKSSWLETALNKGPESPKPKANTPQQPSWMAEINKAKKDRASVDLSRSGGFKQVEVGGLMRAPAPGISTKPGPASNISQPSRSETRNLARSNSDDMEEQKRQSISPPTGPKPAGPGSQQSDINRNSPSEQAKSPPSISDDRISPPSSKIFTQTSNSERELPVPLGKARSPSLQKSKPETPPKKDLRSSLKTSTAKPVQTVSAPKEADDHSNSVERPGSGDQARQPPQRTKPETPPKKDFRSNLKPKNIPTTTASQEEPEFKNVFGKLRRTQTQNYVAPNELKGNILRGKAGLSASGGPAKSERKDELKESLLKQKESMKDKPDQGLSRSKSGSIGADLQTQTTPEAVSRQKSLSRPKPEDRPAPRAPEKQPSAPARLQEAEPATNKGIANRFNPGLAAMIARGPKAVAPTAESSKDNDGTSTGLQRVESSSDKNSEGPPAKLTHTTKSRARGPKRRLPASKQSDTPSAVPDTRDIAPVADETRQSPDENQIPPLEILTSAVYKDTKVSAKPETPSKKPNLVSSSREATPTSANPQSSKPPPPVKSPRVASVSQAPLVADPKANSSVSEPRQSISNFRPPVKTPSPENTRPLDNVVDEEPAVSVRTASASWGQSPRFSSPSTQRAKSPIKLPTHRDEEAAMVGAGLRAKPDSSKDPVGLGLQSVFSQPKARPQLDKNLPSPPLATSPAFVSAQDSSKPLPKLKSPTVEYRLPAKSSNPSSPIPHTSEASRLLSGFFGDIPKVGAGADVDAQAALSSKPNEDTKIKTLRKQIWELSGGGKQQPLPSDQEHILFEDNMYICTHIFGGLDGARTTEVYFWTGDNVSESAISDAQLFAKKIARENNGKLISFQQGRESSKFFQALGGIVITRRGSSSRTNSQSPFMLCGRRHLGQIAFDEVDLSLKSLSSAYPYIVSSPIGKIFLWKGTGSGADELGCARLIGMDLGLTGEIEEIDEGREPASFLEVLGVGPKESLPRSSEHWNLKPKYDNFDIRLFRVDHRSRSKIQEIFPFCQSDLDPTQIHFVDAFFDTYILLGHQSKSKASEFQTALAFAQEYGILASSMEDRPFVPTGTVVLDGMPKDLKTVFRKWSDEPSRRSAPSATKTVPLAAAIEATKR
ncbi:MAG: hypothetical protein M4579_001637 [Chaenotheca gracillima]|nr:MAG: hypothetical protein M4579_001637 [Chaenotheca gracillima]